MTDPQGQFDPFEGVPFEETKFVPKTGPLRFLALIAYVLVVNAWALFSLAFQSGSTFFWPKRWW